MFGRKSLFWKYIRTIMIIFLAGFILFGSVVITNTIKNVQKVKENMLQSNANSIIEMVNVEISNEIEEQVNGSLSRDYFDFFNYFFPYSDPYSDLYNWRYEELYQDVNIKNYVSDKSTLINYLKIIAKSVNSDFFIADENGNIIYSYIKCGKNDLLKNNPLSNSSCLNMLTLNATDIDEINESGISRISTLGTVVNVPENLNFGDSINKYLCKEQHIVAKPMQLNNKKNIGYILVTTNTYEITQLSRAIFDGLVIATLMVLFIIIIVVAVWTYKMFRPLHQMVIATKSFAQGDFSKRVDVSSEDEIGQLSYSFNQMADSLASSENVRRSFVANVSHELKTPMTTISGFVDGILDGTIPAEKQNNYLRIVSSEVRRLSRLVESMLSLSRIDSGELKLRQENFNISSTIFNTFLTFENNIESKHIDIRGLDSINNDIQLVGDPDMIHQVVYNLVENAVKFVNEGGYIEVKAIETNDKCIIKIINSGHGIEQDELMHIFEKFYKTDKSRSIDRKGMGLGLYIVKTILRLHGGDIYASSKIDEYTCFEFFIPKKELKSHHLLKGSSKSDNAISVKADDKDEKIQEVTSEIKEDEKSTNIEK